MKLISILLFLTLCTTVIAQQVISQGNITLLALMENGTTQSGGVAVLALEIIPGHERVFLETYPMTKITTQASLRFAQQVACKELDIDCSHYDFLFTIQALPGIVGGPSAGGAATILTSALLLNKTLDPEMAMTGTINSGGIIGPVGGLRFKFEAADAAGIKRVYVPRGIKAISFGNKTLGLVEYGQSLELNVREVDTISEVLAQEIGRQFPLENQSLAIDERYGAIMHDVAEDLCDRTLNFSQNPLGHNATIAKNFTTRAETELARNASYSAASYCFRANVEYKRVIYEARNFSASVLTGQSKSLRIDAERSRAIIDNRTITTLTDLQTYMAVRERIDESLTLLDLVDADLAKGKLDPQRIGFVEERLFSAKTWSRFFDGSGASIEINPSTLQSGCTAKISEAEERFNYVKSVLPDVLEGTRKDIDLAYTFLNSGQQGLCIYTAAKAKAEADVLLGLMGVEEGRLGELIALKLRIAKTALMKAQEKDVFPIIAYSYYEYADSLQDFDPASALLFSEYALELANLDIYFHKRVDNDEKTTVWEYYWERWASAVAILLILLLLIFVGRSGSASARRVKKTLQAPPKRRLRGKKR
ncbi:hypothetical protein J4211_04530 [Candidatus Woesearchaeota archaeon]|nr:hypothetical protein [Candidatus Woesearchaeota archaeon]